MKVYSKRATGALALLASAALVLSACSSGSTEPAETDDGGSTAASTDALKIGTLLPQTGSLSFLMPPVQAGIYQAIEEINAAGGVLGQDVEIAVNGNEGDSTDTTVLDKAVDEVLASDAQFVLGAMSSGMTLRAIDKIVGQGVMMGSPSNTAAALNGYDPFYFRTAPPDTVQGSALANLMLADGKSSVAFLVFNDDYGLGLRDTIQEKLEEAGASIVYGGNGAGQEFPVDQKSFSSEVTAVTSSGADAVVILTFDQSKQIIPELAAQGFDLSNAYLVDGNTVDYSEDFDPGLLEGAQGTIPGAQANDEFREQLRAIYQEREGQELNDMIYGPEAYDLVHLVALAAVRGGGTDAQTIQENIRAVSGSEGGEECETFADCAALLEDGSEIRYMGKAGTGPLNENNDPSTAFIGIYQYNAENTNEYVRSIEG